MKRRPSSRQKRKLKAIKRLARHVKVRPTRLHGSKTKHRPKHRTLEELLIEEGWR